MSDLKPKNAQAQNKFEQQAQSAAAQTDKTPGIPSVDDAFTMRAAELVFPPLVRLKMSSADYMKSIADTQLPPGAVAIWHLGNNSFIIKTSEGTLVAIDPYLTDYCASARTGKRTEKSRILPVFIEPEDLQVDAVALTHSHCDHADPYTLERLACRKTALFLGPWQTAPILQQAGIAKESIQIMHPLQEVKVKDVTFTGTFALPTGHDDLNHIGYLLTTREGKKLYNTGDSARCELLAHVANSKPDVMMVCINGGYHNLSHWEAAEMTALVKPVIAVPSHFDMVPHNLQPPYMFRKSLSVLAPEVRYHQIGYYECLIV